MSQVSQSLHEENRIQGHGMRMNSQIVFSGFRESALNLMTDPLKDERRWYAVFTLPQNEKSAIRHLHLRNIEAFLPTYDTIRVWKNRQRVKIVLPLFPNYLFVRINHHERVKVLQSPGVLRLVGNGRRCVPLEDAEIEFIRSGLFSKRFEPYHELAVGEKVRIRSGVMQGVEGILVRKRNSLRFVLVLKLINLSAAVEVDADSLESLFD
jgi:transcription antitermination factor NusG